MNPNTIDVSTTPYLIITDLDGTLLDHDNYSFAAALPALDKLQRHHIPVVINSSKTAAEISTLKQQLNNQHPFIIENGSAIFSSANYAYGMPDAKSKKQTEEANSAVNATLKETILGERRSHILEVIRSIEPEFRGQFTQYDQCSYEDIAKLTGLSLEEAKQSSDRQYTEPLKWLGDEARKADFIQAIEQKGLHTLQGGRFLHVMGLTDKGQASMALKERYQQNSLNPITTIALGDSQNDVAMLQAADIAIVIRSAHYEPPEFEHPHKIISTLYGPAGWNECIQSIIFNQ